MCGGSAFGPCLVMQHFVPFWLIGEERASPFTFVTPVRPYVRTYVRTSVQRRQLSKSNTFDQNFVNFGHII